jgi:hypothetical protein
MTWNWTDEFTVNGGKPSLRLGTRYDLSGRFLPEHGNTVVAQVEPGSQTEAALVDLATALRALPYGHLFAFTPRPSYHMTVFEGVIETRREASHWPQGLDPQASIPETTEAMAARLANITAPPPFAMRVEEVTPFGLHLTGATAQDETNARAWRNALSQALGLRTPTHDTYGFHVTLAYVTNWPPASAVQPYQQALRQLTTAFQAAIPVLHLQRPAFCTFADMTAFPKVLPL